jgi:hypothetical protein
MRGKNLSYFQVIRHICERFERMGEVLRELSALVSGSTLPDVPVPACLNHCINQEAFACKVSVYL